MKLIKLSMLVIPLLIAIPLIGTGQVKSSINLEEAINLALENNQLLKIKAYQVEEKVAKWNESRIKALPSIMANSTWQFNQNLGELTISQGEFGTLPLSPQMIIPLPSSDLHFPLSKHESFIAGVTIYQPIIQLGKIKAGAGVSKTELKISEKEREKTAAQIRQTVEKLYYAILITDRQEEEAQTKKELASLRIADAESALKAGKIPEVSVAGLKAARADEEQKLIRLRYQKEDYLGDFCTLTRLENQKFVLAPVDLLTENQFRDTIPVNHLQDNSDLGIARLQQDKAVQGVTAARWSYLPDAGLIAGYSYQKGNKIYPEKNPFVGATLKWNLQEIMLNRQLVNQRKAQLMQAQEQVDLLEQQTANEAEKLTRKLSHAGELVRVAREAAGYRTEELRIEQEKLKNGLSTPSGVLNAKANLAKAEADYLSACLNYRMVRTELDLLFNY
ncbi:MAG TPA: TolC family protein [Prolixibacteraceae bacterium]|nr:TolC family protein [Prolixibacteraceae bacterium]